MSWVPCLHLPNVQVRMRTSGMYVSLQHTPLPSQETPKVKYITCAKDVQIVEKNKSPNPRNHPAGVHILLASMISKLNEVKRQKSYDDTINRTICFGYWKARHVLNSNDLVYVTDRQRVEAR